jgi:carbonic anhydrase
MPRALIDRLQQFRERHYPKHAARYRELAAGGQSPGMLFIGCSDSRLMPQMLLDSAPGEVFMVRNAGNLIPPYEGGEGGFHGTCAAIEFAVLVLGVRDIVVCGHSHCGAIRALYREAPAQAKHLAKWLELAREAVLPVIESDDALRRVEQRSVVLQIEHLLTYPMVGSRSEAGELKLHGWHYMIEEGEVSTLDLARGSFHPVPQAEAAFSTPF